MLSAIFYLLAWSSFYAPQQPVIASPGQNKKVEPPKVQAGEEREKKKRAPEIESLIGEARQAPPEFTADALIRLATSSRVTEKEWKIELLEEAFRTASHAQYPYQLWGTGVFHTDTRTGIRHNAHTQIDLSAMSLKCRVVKSLLPIDGRKARELFEEIPAVKLEPMECHSTHHANLESYYQTLAEVANSTFSAEEIKREDPLFFVQSRISAITSPLQVYPAFRTIASFKGNRSQISRLFLAFTEVLKKLPGDARSFLEANRTFDLAGHIKAFLNSSHPDGAIQMKLLDAVRSYFVQNLSAARCSGTDTVKPYIVIVDRFNNAVAGLPGTSMIAPITREEIASAKIEGAVELVEFWQSAKAKPFLLKLKQLRFGIGEPPNTTGTKALTEAERTEVKWQKQLTEFLQDFRAWRSDHERSEADYFHQKCMALMSLRELVSDETTREAVLREYIGVLSESPMQREHPMEWLLHVQPLLRYSRAEDTANIHLMIQTAGSPSLTLYDKLERLFPPKTK